MAKLQLKINSFQENFLRRAEESLIICQTGVGTGKSEALALWALLRVKSDESVIVGAQTYSALDKVLFRKIKKWAQILEFEYSFNKGAKEFAFSNGQLITRSY